MIDRRIVIWIVVDDRDFEFVRVGQFGTGDSWDPLVIAVNGELRGAKETNRRQKL